MRRRLALLPAILIAISIVAVPAGYAQMRKNQLKNFRVVEDGVLYRSGQLNRAGLERVIHDYGIRTVISFRFAEVEGQEPPDKWEEDVCYRLGVNYVRIRPEKWWTPDERVAIPADKGVDQFLTTITDARKRPVLVHCNRGVHRTGSYCAIFRMECQGWSNVDAMNELKELGYDNLDNEEDVRGYMEQYVPRKNPAARKK